MVARVENDSSFAESESFLRVTSPFFLATPYAWSRCPNFAKNALAVFIKHVGHKCVLRTFASTPATVAAAWVVMGVSFCRPISI